MNDGDCKFGLQTLTNLQGSTRDHSNTQELLRTGKQQRQ